MEPENQAINITVDGECKELVIRHGEALQPVPKEFVRINANIFAPADFAHKRSVHIIKHKAHVVCHRNAGSITLVINEHDGNYDRITGVLTMDSALASFKINENYTYTIRDLISFMRLKRMHFNSREDHARLMSSLNALVLKGEVNVQNQQDSRGNKVANKKVELTTNIPASFILSIPIFTGGVPNTFQVDVCLDYTDAGVKVWLESVELEELKVFEKNHILDAQLERLGDYVIVNV